MKIVVCIKEVPVRDSQLRPVFERALDRRQRSQFRDQRTGRLRAEEALQLKEKHGGEVIALCAGPSRASQSIREALAKGADRALLIEEEQVSSWDTLSLARLLAKAVRPENPDLILTGLQSDDLGYGQTGVVLAELLRFPHATIIMAVEVANGSIRVKRELESGWFQHIEMPLPAVSHYPVRHQQTPATPH